MSKADLVYQKKIDSKQVQTEFRHKHIKKKDKQVEKPKTTKKTILDFYGAETTDQPHLESFK